MQIIKGRQFSASKVCLYAPEGIGKTTFAAQMPNPVFIDTEGGSGFLDVCRTPRPTSWTMLLDQIRYFIANPQELGTLVIDTLDWAERLCIEQFCATKQIKGIEDMPYGRGYVYVAEEFGRMLNLLEELRLKGVHIFLTAHATLRKFEQPDEMGSYDKWELKLSKKVAPMVKEFVDALFFANYETYIVKNEEKKNKAQGGRRVIYTSHHPCWDAKNRYGLPDKLPLDFGLIAGLFAVPTAAVAEGYSVTAPGSAAGAFVERTAESRPYRADANNGAPAQVSQATNVSAQSNGTPPHPSALQTPSPQGEGYAGDPLPLITEPDPDVPFTGPSPEPPAGVPQALWDLMQAHGVTEAEIVAAVAQKGYFPPNMRLANYPADFVQGVLIGAWEQVHLMIVNNRNNGKENS